MELDDLARRIVGALQVDGRASWRRIADALGESHRTVARRGGALLDSGSVRVVGLSSHLPCHLIWLHCAPSEVSAVAAEVADWPESVFVYSLAGTPHVAAELMAPFDEIAELVRDRVAPLSGLRDYRLRSAVDYYRTVASWRPGLLSAEETAALESVSTPERYQPDQQLDAVDRALVRALVRDGRAPSEELAGSARISEPTVRRRLEALRSQGAVHIRAVVEPQLLGLPLEAMVRLECQPGQAAVVGEALAAARGVRYAALMLGERSVIVDAAVANLDELRGLIAGLPAVNEVECDFVRDVFKRSGVRLPSSDLPN